MHEGEKFRTKFNPVGIEKKKSVVSAPKSTDSGCRNAMGKRGGMRKQIWDRAGRNPWLTRDGQSKKTWQGKRSFRTPINRGEKRRTESGVGAKSRGKKSIMSMSWGVQREKRPEWDD